MHIFDIDEQISKDAAEGIRTDAPDLSWVYLWYTDDAGHIAGNGAFFDEYVRKADEQVARIWEAVKYREANLMKNGWSLLPPIMDAERMDTTTGDSPGVNVRPGFQRMYR